MRSTLRKAALLTRDLRTRMRASLTAVEPERPRSISDFNEFCTEHPTRRALVSYVVDPLLDPAEHRDKVRFSNRGIAQEIPRALNEMGYVVDIVQYDHIGWQLSSRYDLFIGHGGINFEQISSQLHSDTVHIYFSTGIYWREFNVRGARRILDLAMRRGYLLTPDRRILASEEHANEAAAGIICLGNQEAVRTYDKFPCVIGINNAVYPTTWAGLESKDFEQGRHSFLFFSGPGNIHKGLDLLLEAFASTELHLHVCQDINHDFAKVYRYELSQCPNIHVHGFVPMRSPRFESLVASCNWVISATCAEGQPGAILECMGHGLIPVLPSSANIDLGHHGVLLPDCAVETIRSVVLRATQVSAQECRERAFHVRELVRQEHSPQHFNSSFKAAIQQILAFA